MEVLRRGAEIEFAVISKQGKCHVEVNHSGSNDHNLDWGSGVCPLLFWSRLLRDGLHILDSHSHYLVDVIECDIGLLRYEASSNFDAEVPSCSIWVQLCNEYRHSNLLFWLHARKLAEESKLHRSSKQDGPHVLCSFSSSMLLLHQFPPNRYSAKAQACCLSCNVWHLIWILQQIQGLCEWEIPLSLLALDRKPTSSTH